MLEKDAYTTVCDLLKPEAFYEPAHQKIYEAIQQLGASQQPIDMLTVTERLRAMGELNAIGDRPAYPNSRPVWHQARTYFFTPRLWRRSILPAS